MTKGATMLKRASQYAVRNRGSSDGRFLTTIRLAPGSGKTKIVSRDLYADALEKAGKKLWAKAKASRAKGAKKK
jgi:hypothetical protein